MSVNGSRWDEMWLQKTGATKKYELSWRGLRMKKRESQRHQTWEWEGRKQYSIGKQRINACFNRGNENRAEQGMHTTAYFLLPDSASQCILHPAFHYMQYRGEQASGECARVEPAGKGEGTCSNQSQGSTRIFSFSLPLDSAFGDTLTFHEFLRKQFFSPEVTFPIK